MGTISSNDKIGGLIGFNGDFGSQVINSFSAMNVNGQSDIGAVIGYNVDTDVNNLYAYENQNVNNQPVNDNNLIGLDTTQNQKLSIASQSNLTTSDWYLNSLNFNNMWQFNDGYYPILYKIEDDATPSSITLNNQQLIDIV